MKWNKADVDSNVVRQISSRYNLDLLTSSIFARRNIVEKEDIFFYLENNTNYLHNPFLFVEMETAVDRILLAHNEGEKILIFGDRDVDGITATVILYRVLRDKGFDVDWAVPEGDDAYGLTNEVVDRCSGSDVSLIITVDCGISCASEVAYAAEKGIDVIVTDHHNPPETLPPAVAVINPKLEDSGYPFEHLAGCAVSAKLAFAVLFGFSELYNHSVTLLNIRPGNDAYIMEAVICENMVEVDRMTEVIVPGIVSIDNSKLNKFFAGKEIFVYDAPLQDKMLRRMFGRDVQIGLIDIAPHLYRLFPALQNKSLLNLAAHSKLSAYREAPVTEIDILHNMFYSFVLKANEAIREFLHDTAEFVALGTLADMMPLKDENRIFVKTGIDKLNKKPGPHFHELLFKQKLAGKKISSIDLSWHISPLINSTGRLGVPGKAVNYFLEPDTARLSVLADEIIGINSKRKKLGTDTWKSILPQAKSTYKDFNGKLVMTAGKSINRGITGIVATRLTEYFSAPAVVASFLDHKIVGSVRSFGGMNVKNLLQNFEDYFEDFGGHDYAAGFHITHNNWEPFLQAFKSHVSNMDNVEVEEEVINIDADLPLSYFKPSLIDVVNKFEPYGEGNSPLVFSVKNVGLASIEHIGKNGSGHLRILVDSGENKWPAVFWNAADRLGIDFEPGDTVDIAFRLGRNYYMNQEKLQLTILDIKSKN